MFGVIEYVFVTLLSSISRLFPYRVSIYQKHTEYLQPSNLSSITLPSWVYFIKYLIKLILSSISSNSDLPSIYWPYYLPSFSKTKKFIEYLFASDLTEYLQVSGLPSFFVRKSVEFLQYKKLSSFFCETCQVSNFGNCRV